MDGRGVGVGGGGGVTPNISFKWLCTVKLHVRAQELCESRGGRPGLPVHNSPYGLCGRKATLNSRAKRTEAM